MSVKLMRQRDGSPRAHWYGVYGTAGARKVVNLDVPWKGAPPASGSLRDPGDAAFERSREKAEEALARIVDELRHKGRVEHLTERLIESKTGRAVEYARIDALPDRWRNLGREMEATEAHLVNCDAHFQRFIAFMRKRKPAAVRLYEVTPEDAAAFVKELRANLAPATAQYGIRLLSKAASRFLPVGSANPFADLVGKRGNGASGVIHREPFSPEELRAILAAARDDALSYGLVVTAACTGMRRGDVCGLKWADVDLAAGMLAVKTSKTEAAVEIPIFAPLRAVLEERFGNGSPLVFPEAELLLNGRKDPAYKEKDCKSISAKERREKRRAKYLVLPNRNKLTHLFKAIMARALDGKALPEPVPASDIEAEAVQAIRGHVPEGPRRERMLANLKRYAAGESIRDIEKATNGFRSTVSADLHAVENWIGKHFMRTTQGEGVNNAIARLTRQKRAHGQKSASVRDWHALRTTFVTVALSAGVPLELVRRVTGHASVEIVLKHYFRPDREQFRAALTGALPDVLTGGTSPAKVKPADELATLAGKLAAGKATKEDKARLRKLAGQV